MADLTPQDTSNPLHALVMLIGERIRWWIPYSLYIELHTRAGEMIPWRYPN